MKTPKDIAIMLSGFGFIRVDGLYIYGNPKRVRTCVAPGSGIMNGRWGISQGYTLLITKDGEIWVRLNQDLPDINGPHMNICTALLESSPLNCVRCHTVNRYVLLEYTEQFSTYQLLSRLNNPEWKPK